MASKLVEHTFFAHFCGGVDQDSLVKPLDRLESLGIRAILDYAAEDDPEKVVEKRHIAKRGAVGRVYDYSGEAACDLNMTRFLSAIESAAEKPGGVVAIKITALCKPNLLITASRALNAIRGTWIRHFRNENTTATLSDFARAIGPSKDPEFVKSLFNALDNDNTGQVDFLEWTSKFDLESLVTRKSWERHGLEAGALYEDAVISSSDTPLLDNMRARVEMIAHRAASLNVRLLIDAEHTYIQPAIEQITRELQLRYNQRHREFPIVFNTYQCYLKRNKRNVLDDLERARRANLWFAGKLVRGAYIVRERERAIERNETDPIFPTIAETHDNFNWCVEEILKHIDRSEVFVATHNQESIERAVTRMEDFKIPNDSPRVMFAQLLGMADHLSLTLGREGYNVYKYVPFGPVAEVIPYLTRRAQENSDMMLNVGTEIGLLKSALRSRGLPVP